MLLALGLACLLGLYLGIGPERVLPGDEMRFIQTSRSFADSFGLELLRHYEEMSTPLPFVIFGLWGKIFGFDLGSMRLGALLLTLLTIDQLGRFCQDVTTSRRQAWLVAAGTCFANPYFLPLGIMVYTDIPSLFFLLLGARACYRSDPLGLAIGCAGMLLCRQYLAFLVPAYMLLQGWRWLCLPTQRRAALAMTTAIAIGCLPLVGLVLMWGGLTPDNATRLVYAGAGQAYHLNSLVLYCALLTWFCHPALLACRQALPRSWTVLLVPLLLSQAYWLFPVRPSPVAAGIDQQTVGLLHRALKLIDPAGRLADLVFFLGFFVALGILWAGLRQAAWYVRQREGYLPLLPVCAVFCFLLVMPWSYLHWEKYFLPAIPFALLMISEAGG